MPKCDDYQWPSQEDVSKFAEVHGGWWTGEHPVYSLELWRWEAYGLETRLGYWEWAMRQVDGEMGE